MSILTSQSESYSVFDLGFDKNLAKSSVLSLIQETPPEMSSTRIRNEIGAQADERKDKFQ